MAMRIAYVITRGDDIGGAQIHVLDLVRNLHNQGHDVCVFMGKGGILAEMLSEQGLRWELVPALVHPISPIHDGIALAALLRRLYVFHPDVLAAHSSKAGILARLTGWLLGIPTVFTVHGWSFTDGVPEPKRRLFRFIERMVAPLAKRLICVSQYDEVLAKRELVADPRQLVTIHNGIPDVEPNCIADPMRSPVVVVMVGRMASQKDHTLAIRAIAQVPDAHLDLVGDGPKREQLRQLAEDYGVAERVRFLGYRADVSQVLSQAQIFVLATNYEGFPMSILEAMRAGLPVIASDVGGISEAVVDGETGYLVPKGDLTALAEKLRALTGDGAKRSALGRAGRQRFLEHFVLSRMIERTVAVYKEAMNEHTASKGVSVEVPVSLNQ